MGQHTHKKCIWIEYRWLVEMHEILHHFELTICLYELTQYEIR